jgi:hypothetical protein
MSFINDIPYCPKKNTNDYDLFFKNLLRDIITFNQEPKNHCDYDNANNFSYISEQFKYGIVVDNFGVDINNNNQSILDNISETNYMVTYRRDNTVIYVDDCRDDVEYYIFIKVKDCEPNFARLNTLADVFIDSIINNRNTYELEFASTFTFNNQLGKKHKYITKLREAEVQERFDAMSESHNNSNYLYTSIRLKLQIIQTI